MNPSPDGHIEDDWANPLFDAETYTLVVFAQGERPEDGRS